MTPQLALLVLCALAILPEVIVLLVSPTWLVLLPMWVVSERRFTLRSPRRLPGAGGYRDATGLTPAMPELPARMDFDDSVLFASGSRIALRRAFGFGRRAIWLLRVEIFRDGDAIVMRARQCFVPMTVVLVAPMMGYVIGGGQLLPIVGFTAVMIVSYFVQIAFETSSRRAACEVAFGRIEAELRRDLEAKSDHRFL